MPTNYPREQEDTGIKIFGNASEYKIFSRYCPELAPTGVCVNSFHAPFANHHLYLLVGKKSVPALLNSR